MALLYAPQKKPQTIHTITAEILDLDYQGLGVAKVNGKTWFIENALPGEKVIARVTEEKRQYGLAVAQKWLQKNTQRLTPACGYYKYCGGCQGQHIPLEMQCQAKQNALFSRLSKLQREPIELMPMISGAQWGYRRRIRLSLLWNAKNKCLDMGFRQKNSNQLVAIQQCLVAEPALNNLLPKLTALLSQFSQPKQLGHIELVNADNGIAMLLRYSRELNASDRQRLCHFAQVEGIHLFLQSDNGIERFYGEEPAYQLNDGSRLQFDIRDFIQVNGPLNQQMITTALDWLELQANDRVLDLFCGMGNFTLPLSRLAGVVVGVEGVQEMVIKAEQNAIANHCLNIQFYQTDLSASFVDKPWAREHFNKILLDPPRSGAAFALQALCDLNAEKILYVSCNPATLVRDAEILCNAGYRIQRTAMIDMFPHTAHLESITLFSKS